MKAKQRGRPVKQSDLSDIASAMQWLGWARNALRRAGAHNSALYVQRALKSVQGASNNAHAHFNRQLDAMARGKE